MSTHLVFVHKDFPAVNERYYIPPSAYGLIVAALTIPGPHQRANREFFDKFFGEDSPPEGFVKLAFDHTPTHDEVTAALAGVP